ncbi:DUF3644 domain-containing protein [Streptosporangium sp. NPDC023963]|uniref:DUF3644 domain-containing protein n=1 Tax=Streptosporangium sp. NPDC023963 TaxID=3155608 RepID=UPI00342A345B
MRLRQEARVLKEKAISSMVTATEAFNSPHDKGRATRVLLHLQHSFEMLLKAALVQKGISVFDPTLGRSLGFETCVRKAMEHPDIKLSESDAGTLRAIDALRDEEQHWFNQVSEQLLYVHARAAVTLFDDLLQRVFKEPLATYLPFRVLPVSVDPPRDLSLLLDEEYTQIAALLQPGRRATHEARARIRTLLAMEAHTGPETRVSSKDVDRVQAGVRGGASRSEVFPRLQQLATATDGEGLLIKLRFVKNDTAPPVRYVADETVPAAAIREVDLQAKFHRSATDLAKDLDMTRPRCTALRRHLGIDTDPTCCHEFIFDSQRLPRFSDNAFNRLRTGRDTLDLEAVWRAHNPSARKQESCAVPDCQAK